VIGTAVRAPRDSRWKQIAYKPFDFDSASHATTPGDYPVAGILGDKDSGDVFRAKPSPLTFREMVEGVLESYPSKQQ